MKYCSFLAKNYVTAIYPNSLNHEKLASLVELCMNKSRIDSQINFRFKEMLRGESFERVPLKQPH